MQRYVSKLLWQFRPDVVWTAMADKTESELDAVKQAVYHDVDENELSMLFRVSQLGGKTLLIRSFTERKISQMVQGATGIVPVGSNSVRFERSSLWSLRGQLV